VGSTSAVVIDRAVSPLGGPAGLNSPGGSAASTAQTVE